MVQHLQQILALDEFRAALAPWPQVTELLTAMAAAEVPSQGHHANVPDSSALARQPAELRAFLTDIGTALWRLRNHLQATEAERSAEVARKTTRHLESVWTALGGFGVQIRDHTAEPFHHGLALRVISYQPVAGIGRERVLETIRPTIYFRDDPLQMGEVVVATPDLSDPLNEARRD